MESVRMDKWLWAARFFKTRALASKACELGRVQANGLDAKASRDVRVGQRLTIRNEGGTFEVDVLGISEMRGPAAVAQALYRETEESRAARAQAAEQQKALAAYSVADAGRPSKRDRRLIQKFRGRG
uniref:RNA-binding S4 domain-containing protein n=1 Tax=Acidobacterium capsulatum TaxID=33075 RepID=A0A7V4XTY1_9BACT